MHSLPRALLEASQHGNRREAFDAAAVHAQYPDAASDDRARARCPSNELVLAQDGERARRHPLHLRVLRARGRRRRRLLTPRRRFPPVRA